MKKKVTIQDIATRLGVSPTTVSFVLNGRKKGISEKTRKQIINAADKLNYRKLPRPDVSGQIKVAELIHDLTIFNFYTSFFAGVHNCLQAKASKDEIELSIKEFKLEDEEKSYLKLQELCSAGIDIFLVHSRDIARYLLKHEKKVILLQGGIETSCVSIYCDDYTAGAVSAGYAWDNGHRVAGMVFPASTFKYPRFHGFEANFRRLGGRIDENFIVTGNFNHQNIYRATIKMIKQKERPTFFYCFADNIAIPFMKALADHKVKVPEDVSVMGTDNLYWGRWLTPALTTIDLCENTFADRVIDGIKHVYKTGNDEPYQLAVPVKLVERESVRCCRAKTS